MENKNAFKELEEILEKLRQANRKLQEHADKTNPQQEKEGIILPFKKHNEQ